MPSIADLRLAASPLADPLCYPGEAIDANYLLLDPWVYDIAPLSGAVPGQWEIRVDGGPLAAAKPESAPVPHPERLDHALALVGAPALRERRPVMAFGSNGAPTQLLDKFVGMNGRHRVVPVMRGVVQGLALSHSPHVSPPGYLPYVLVRSGPQTELRVFVLWLDSVQLRALNRTEPNYRLEIIQGYPIVVETGELIAEYHAYRGRWGALRWIGSVDCVSADRQDRLFQKLSGTGWFVDLVGSGEPAGLVSRLAGDPQLRAAVRLELARRGLVTSDGLGVGQDVGA